MIAKNEARHSATINNNYVGFNLLLFYDANGKTIIITMGIVQITSKLPTFFLISSNSKKSPLQMELMAVKEFSCMLHKGSND